MATARKRVLSGMRPTGRLHIGHYFGALNNWVKLQSDPAFECFFFVADWHALTSDYADTSQVAQNTIEIGIDWLAAGLDPAKCTLFVQSEVPEHAELHLLLSMITPLSWLERVPTYKEQIENVKDKDLHTYGFLGYPLLQTADIVMYGEPGADLFVPVGADQAPHVEMSREIVRRLNAAYAGINWGVEKSAILGLFPTSSWSPATEESHVDPMTIHVSRVTARDHFSKEQVAESLEFLESHFRAWSIEERLARLANAGITLQEVLREPRVLLTATPRIPGTDGRKMSKSYGNAVTLSESNEEIRKKARGMMTDPARKLRKDPGNPDVCPVFDWHKLFSGKDTIDRVNRECRTAEIGCVDCKGLMADALVKWIEPVRARRVEYERHPDRVLEILETGSRKARVTAQQTMGRVREAIFGRERKRKEVESKTKAVIS